MMQNLFSHVHEPDYVSLQPTEEAALEVVIGVPSDEAFDGFTDGIHLWWPVAEQSVFGESSHVAMLRDHLVEESLEGEEIILADIESWESPTHLSLVWAFGNESVEEREVDISFDLVEGGMTRVKATFHTLQGLDSLGEGEFFCDWSLILSRYARFMGGAVQLD
ncbi:hypothetical protein [Arthrobacter psychrochitiniphilus]|nr:hypothetical protein [Arthrobacter psychrochitiniphilus]